MSSQPSALHCPSCGGDAQPDSVRCSWCGSSLATVACPRCFGKMFVGMTHCPWCGQKGSREESPAEAVGLCPRCQKGLSAVKVGETHLNECQSCGGLWVDKG